jgi:hypothetical protein
MRTRLNKAIKKVKSKHTLELIGCSAEELKVHLESQFQPGMTWENYGRTGWQVDHIYPLSKALKESEEKFNKMCHYTNLQPLWSVDNSRKKDKIV